MGVLWSICELGPSTFRRLQESCETISPTVLNSRLKELQAAKFVERSDEGYVATALGRRIYSELVPLGETARIWSSVLEQDPADQ